jgi:hypothetical protein
MRKRRRLSKRPDDSENGLEERRLAMMETVLFTDHTIILSAITMSAGALMFSVLGVATTRQKRSEHELRGLR